LYVTGQQLYADHCASCHGVSGHGDGPVGAMLKAPPSDLTRLASRNGGMFPSARAQRIIDGREIGSHGNPDMPVWGVAFKRGEGLPDEIVRARIEAIVKYLESIQERAGN
jgi:mono/diheme cytochrome c family protein